MSKGNPGTNPGPGKGELVPQPHGGALKRGGTNPGGGRPPNELRRSMRDILEKGLPYLEEFAKGERGKPADQLRAFEIAARYGLEVKVDKSLVDELWAVVELKVSAEEAAKIKKDWNRIIGRKLVEAIVT